MSSAALSAIVIDNGSYTIKAGLTGEDDPKSIFRTVVHTSGGEIRPVGEAVNPIGDSHYPIRRGVPCDWDALEGVWEYTFKDVLKVTPREHKVLLTDRPLAERANREKAVQIMFEKFSTPATYVSMQALLALYGSGRTSGTVVDVGDGLTSVVPIVKSTPVKEAIVNVDLAGCDMVDYLAGALNVGDREVAREVMEKVCAVSANMAQESAHTVECKTAHGTVVTVGAERFRCGEALFNPAAIGHQQGRALPELIAGSVASCKEATRKDLYASIVLAGGSTKLRGFSERLQQELAGRIPSTNRFKVVVAQDPTLTVWAGGCLVAQSPVFDQYWVTKEEYEEHGAEIVHRKCV
uniref:Actin n=1 Tax=Anopheles dirus TaxID=7168 RepID=A0A182NNK6_9DIPT